MVVSAAAHIYTTILDVCTQLQSVHFSFGWAPSAYFRLGWERLVGAIPHLPPSVHLLILEVDFVVEIDLLRGVEDLRRSFDGLVVERRPPTVVSVRPNDRPMFGIHEQTQITALFPQLTADALLQF